MGNLFAKWGQISSVFLSVNQNYITFDILYS